MKIILLSLFALQALGVNAAVIKTKETSSMRGGVPKAAHVLVVVSKKTGGGCECSKGSIKKSCPCNCQRDSEFAGPEVLSDAPRCQPGVHIRPIPCDCYTSALLREEASEDAGPVSADPKVWPSNRTVEEDAEEDVARVEQDVSQDVTAQEETIEKNSRKGDLWQCLLTWVVLIAVSLFLRSKMRSRSWRPSDRAPYTAFLMILWTIVFFATFFYFFCSHKWSWVESIYFTVVTVTTVGYGDYVPEDNIADKLMLLVLLWFNMAVLSIVLGLVTTKEEDAVEGASKKSQFQRLLIFVVALVLGGALLFMYLENWNFLKGITFTTVTLTTVGYGHLLPNAGPGSMLTASIFMLFGVPVTGSFVGTVGGMIDDKFKDRKAKMSQKSLLGVYVGLIIGWLFFGAFGFLLTNDQGWTLNQCVYLAAVTMTTVGYGDYTPTEGTVTAHLWVIFYIWGSVVIIATVFGDLDSLLMDDLTKGMHKHKATVTRMSVLGAMIGVGMVGFAVLESWGLLSGLVFTSVTCTTVGYGHLLPSHHIGRLFATFFILISVPLTGCLVSSVSGNYADEISSLISDLD